MRQKVMIMSGLNTLLKYIPHFVLILRQGAWKFMKGYFSNQLSLICLKKNIGLSDVLSNKVLRLKQLSTMSSTKSQVQVKISMHSPRAQQLLKNIPCIFFFSWGLAEPVVFDLQGTQQYLSFSGLCLRGDSMTDWIVVLGICLALCQFCFTLV